MNINNNDGKPEISRELFAKALLNYGFTFYYGDDGPPDYEKALNVWFKAAEIGSLEAEFMVGMCYYFGQGVAKDLDEAVKWYKKGVEKGFAEAQHFLAMCYNTGEGVIKDEIEAVRLNRLAAAQGHTGAMNDLALHYSFILSNDVNYQEAYFWMLLSIAYGDKLHTKDMIDYISEKLSKEEIERVKARIENWLNEHPKKYDINAQ